MGKRIGVGIGVALAVACASTRALPLPEAARAPGVVFVVQHQEHDARRLDQAIAAALRARGLEVATGEAREPDYLVSYVDRWEWDVRVYLSFLRVDVHDARTGAFLAGAQSYETGLSALGKTHASVVDETVGRLVGR